MESLFTKIYKYKETINRNQIENYLIEIFADCLRKDENLRNNFFYKVGFAISDEIAIFTQKTFSNGKRPDISIESQSGLCLVECKVGAYEGPNQLAAYRDILKGSRRSTQRLVFLTKYIQTNQVTENEINITWSDIAGMITEPENNMLSNELKKYLYQNKIAFMKDFSIDNLTSLRNIRETMQKMSQVLESIKREWDEGKGATNNFVYEQKTRIQKLEAHSAFYDKVQLPENLILDIGFFGFDTDKITVGVRFYSTEEEKISKLHNFFNEKRGWEKQDISNGAWIGKYQLLNPDNNSFLSIDECVTFIHETLREINTTWINKEIN